MRKLTIFSIVAILAACMFVGCGGDDDDDDNNDNIMGSGGNGIDSYATMSPGSWAKHNHSDPPGTTTIYKWIGEDNWEGTQCYVMEFETFIPEQGTTISQVWVDKSTGESILFLLESEGKVMRMDVGQTPEVPSSATDETDPDGQMMREDKYTTPTGKTVDVTIYSEDSPGGVRESWISSEVPFGIVQDMLNGQVQSQLYDFSFSGAVRGITKQEALDAEPMGFPDIPDGGGGIPDGGGVGTIVITVGAGARPTISVSQPIHSLLVMQGVMPVWVFESPNMGEPNALSFAGPFQYGVAPNGANETFPNAPDMIAGQDYIIQVTAINNAGIPLTGTYMFTR